MFCCKKKTVASIPVKKVSKRGSTAIKLKGIFRQYCSLNLNLLWHWWIMFQNTTLEKNSCCAGFSFSLLDHGGLVMVKSYVTYTGLHAEVNCYTFKPSVWSQEALAHSLGTQWCILEGGGHSGVGLIGRCSQGSETLTLFKAQFSWPIILPSLRLERTSQRLM